MTMSIGLCTHYPFFPNLFHVQVTQIYIVHLSSPEGIKSCLQNNPSSFSMVKKSPRCVFVLRFSPHCQNYEPILYNAQAELKTCQRRYLKRMRHKISLFKMDFIRVIWYIRKKSFYYIYIRCLNDLQSRKLSESFARKATIFFPCSSKSWD